jgi:TRAP-type C4-dicarboxylate transport system permease small subunit
LLIPGDPMRSFLRLIDGLCGLGAALAAAACLILAIMLVVEVITTSFMAWSQPWAVEYSGYFLAATLFAGTGWTLSQGGHIRVSVVIQLLPARGRWLADLLATAFALGLTVFVTWFMVENAARSFARNSLSSYASETPLWIPQSMLAFGWAVLALGLLARGLRLLRGEAPQTGGESHV